MSIIGTIKHYLQQKTPGPEEIPVVEAYDTWAASYDSQPGNLMLHLDEIIFSSLVSRIDLKNKCLADIGCGTGRHWKKLYDSSPAQVTGYDVSAGMLAKLKEKFPLAITQQITDDQLRDIPAASYDCIVSTLTIAHIPHMEEAIKAWSRILKDGGDLVITDFHPTTLADGGKRSFQHGKRTLSVKNYVHPLDKVKTACSHAGLQVVELQEIFIDDTVRSFYEEQQAMHVYNRYKGMPVIYGFHLKKQYGS